MENLSMFGMIEEAQTQEKNSRHGNLDVVKMEFSGAETVSWQDLFSGFDTLHAITYSSGIGFVYRLLDLFEQAEIIFGCDEVISYSLQEVMAYQCKMVERIRETAGKMKVDLVSRIDQRTLRFYVAHSVLSHEKIYLLSAADGRKRVIMGSANMSFSAFGGHQRENICYLDGEEAYQWYWDCYCQLREESTDQIAKDSLLCADDGENLEQLPIARTIRTQKALVLQPVEEAKGEVRFALDVKNLADKLAPSVPKPDKKGKILLSPEKIKSIRRQVVATKTKEKELQSEYPQLQVFPDEAIVRLNGTDLDLNPPKEDVTRDVQLFLNYMAGYNMPQSLHRLFKLKEYRPGEKVVAPAAEKAAEAALYAKGEKPEALIDWPVDATDYELVDIFNWQDEAAGMISQMEFVRRVDVQTETIERYVREGKLVPDLVVPMSEHRTFKYFKEETLERYARQYGWTLIDDSNRKELFLEMVRQMDMSYSYKPVLIQAILRHADEKGRIQLADIVAYFRAYYEGRRAAGLVVEKPNSLFARGGYTDKEAERNILANPFKRFEDMQMLRHTRTLGIVQVDESVWKKLTAGEKAEMEKICEEKLEQYFSRLAQ